MSPSVTGAPRGAVKAGLTLQPANEAPLSAKRRVAAADKREVEALSPFERDLFRQSRVFWQARYRARAGATGSPLGLDDDDGPVGLVRAPPAPPLSTKRTLPPASRGSVEHEFEARAGRDRHEIAQRLERLARLAVDRDDQRLRALDRDRHHALGRRVGEPQPHPRARGGAQGQRRRARRWR